MAEIIPPKRPPGRPPVLGVDGQPLNTLRRRSLPQVPETLPVELRSGKSTSKEMAQYEEYLRWLELGLRPAQAARKVGLTMDRIRKRKVDFPDFVDAERYAEAVGSEPVEEALRAAALNGNVRAAIEWLERRSTERWAEPAQQVEVRHLVALEAGPRLERIAKLMARLEDRPAVLSLSAGPDPDIIDAEVVE